MAGRINRGAGVVGAFLGGAVMRGLAAPVVAAAALLGGGVGVGVMMGMAPEPDPVPRRWQLTVEPGLFRDMVVDVPGVGPQKYFYMTYKVTNTSGSDVMFAPSFELMNAEEPPLRSGRDVPPAVTREILAQLRSPFLQDQISVVGMLLQGEGNAKEGLVIWPAKSLKVQDLTVYAAGFSGETRTVEVPDSETGKVNRFTLRKQLMLRYQPTAEIRDQGAQPYQLVDSRWILR